MDYIVKLPNTQATFDWLEANVNDWFIDDENNDFVWINFSDDHDQARFAKESLTTSE